jgi:hypothetical protein
MNITASDDGAGRDDGREDRDGRDDDMVAIVFRVQDVVDQTLPVFESVPPSPRIPEPTLDQQREMATAVTAFGSA